MKEEWRDIEGYEGYYQVSDLGRVRSLDRVDCAGKRQTGRLLKQSYTRGNYLVVGLTMNGRGKLFRVNRLVAIAFIDNHHNLPYVGHDDDNKENNVVSNLYWTTAKENNNHNNKAIRCSDKLGKKIIGVRPGERIVFNSSKDAERNGFNSSAIRNCLTGRASTRKGYVWGYYRGDIYGT